MSGVPYIGLKQVDGLTFEVSMLCTTMHINFIEIVRDIVG